MSNFPRSTLLLPATCGAAGALGLSYALAQLRVGLKRASTNKLHGIEPDSELYYLNRAAGTIGEYAPIGLILLALLEHNAVTTPKKLQTWAGLFALFRVAHGLQLALPNKVPIQVRSVSFYGTIALLGAASASLLVSFNKKN